MSSNTSSLEPSLAANLYYYVRFIQVCMSTSTFPSIHSPVVALLLFLGAEEASRSFTFPRIYSLVVSLLLYLGAEYRSID